MRPRNAKMSRAAEMRRSEIVTMSDTQVTALDHSVQQTNIWLKTLGEELHWEDRHDAYRALRAVLHALRDRLTAEQAVHLGAQLSTIVRGLYYEGWRLSANPDSESSRAISRRGWRLSCRRQWAAGRVEGDEVRLQPAGEGTRPRRNGENHRNAARSAPRSLARAEKRVSAPPNILDAATREEVDAMPIDGTDLAKCTIDGALRSRRDHPSVRRGQKAAKAPVERKV